MIRQLLICWGGLLALLAATAGLSLLPLGAAAMPTALVIALSMAVTVALVCMRLGPAPRLAMIFVVGGICWFLVLLGVGSVDYLTRTTHPTDGAVHPAERS